MKFTIAPQALLDGLNIAGAAAATRTPKPVLQGVLIEVLEDSVLLMATDLETGVRCTLEQVEVERQGKTVVPVAKLTQIIRESPDETINIELKEQRLHITGRHEQFEMFTADPQDFPPVSEMEGKPDFTISGTSLRTLIERTIFAAAKESTRYAIDGLLFNYDGERLKLVATDGRRLAMAHAEVQNCGANKSSAIVPAKAMSLIAHMPAGPDENFDIKLLSNQFLLRSPRVTLSSVLLEGHFPKYEDVIPQDCDRTVRVQAPALLGAVRRSALLTSEESRAIRLHFEKNKVVMTGRAPEQGQSSVELEVVYDAEEMDIGFNPNFLSDVLKILGDSEVQLDLKDANRPGLFRSDDYMYVVMPVNLS